ncbi:hypothetical protein ACTFIW_002301 [Dictyostelium discoideum]
MIIILIVFILLTYNNIVKSEVIQFIEWDNITKTNNLHLEFKMGSTVLFSVSNNTGDHNIVIKESFFNSSETLIKSPILNFNNNQIYFIYTFIKDGNYLITDDFSKNSMDIKISSPQLNQQSSNSSKSLNNDSLNNITFSSGSSNDNDGNSNEVSQENENLDFNNFFKDSKEELNDTSSTNLNNKKSIYDFFSNFTISSSNSTIKNSTKSKKPTTIIVRSRHNENPDILLNSDSITNSNSNSNQNSHQNSNSNSIQPPSIYYLIIYVSILFIF